MFLDDEGGLTKLRQPLMDVGASSDEEEGGLLLHSPSSVHDFGADTDSWATRRKRRRRKDDDDLGEVKARGLLAGMTTVEPKFVRAVSRWVLSLSSAASFLGARSGPAPFKAKTSPRGDKPGVMTVPSKRRGDPLEDMTERALAWMAGLTLALALLLILAVAVQNA